MSGIERRLVSRDPSASYDLGVSHQANSTPDPRVSAPRRDAASAAPAHYGSGAAAMAASSSRSVSPPPSPAECKEMPDAVLDRQASALRARLSRSVSYPEQARDAQELNNVEAELQSRVAAKQKEASDAHGGVKVCKRVADLPAKDIHGAQHWWVQTTRKEAGMGPVNGQVPGHGESAPQGLATRLIDHSKEPKDSCEVQAGVDEDCVDRELQLGTDTGTWIPGINDCHTVVNDILDKCQTNTLEKALVADSANRREQANAGAR
jgi:hypothetical protein